MAINVTSGDSYNQNIIYGRNGINVTTSSPINHTIGIHLSENCDFQLVLKRLEVLEHENIIMKEKLFYLSSNPELEEKFESLKQAREAYRLIEKMVLGPIGERNETR